MPIVKQLQDDRYIGCEIIEIESFPEISIQYEDNTKAVYKHTEIFVKMTQEFFALSEMGVTMAEILWLPERIEKQAFCSRIHIFLIIRKIGNIKKVVENELQLIMNSFKMSLIRCGYGIKTIENIQKIEWLLDEIQGSSLCSIVKRELYAYNEAVDYPYYYCEVLPTDNEDNFADIISALSQYNGYALAFQIFPTKLSDREIYYLNEWSVNLQQLSDGILMERRIYKDISAREPAKVLQYYNGNHVSPLFQYNLLVFGEKLTCIAVTAKLISFLQSGHIKLTDTELGCLDLSAQRIDLKRDFLFYPWNINNQQVYGCRNMNLLQFSMVNELKRLSYLMTKEEVAVFFRLPLYEKTMSAIKENRMSQAPQFDKQVIDENNIQFGKLKANGKVEVMIGCPANLFTRHALIVGMTGCGKTTFACNLLLQFAEKQLPFLVIEPTKREYRGLIDAIPGLQIFTPGNNEIAPFIINPFIPPKGIRLEQYIPSLVNAFEAAFSMPSPLDVIFMKAIRMCYTEYGWKEYSRSEDEDVVAFGIYEFILVFKKIITESKYSKEVKGNMESAGVFRLLNLIEQNGNIYDSIHTIPIEDILQKPTVIELNAIDNIEQKSLIMALLLIHVCVYTKQNQIGDGKIKNIILMDEAHVLFGRNSTIGVADKADAQGAAIQTLQNMIKEIRSYGTSIILSDQSMRLIGKDIVAQTEIKVIFRMVDPDERTLIGECTNMEEIGRIAKLEVGEAFVSYEKLEMPQLIKTEDVREEKEILLYVSDDMVRKKTTYWNNKKVLLKPYRECYICWMCKQECDFKIRADADYYASKLFFVCGRRISCREDLLKYVMSIKVILNPYIRKYENNIKKQRLLVCILIKFYRKVRLETSLKMTSRELQIAFERMKE